MRIWPLLAVIVTTAPALADPAPLQAALTPDEVQATVRLVSEELEHCYMDRTPEVRGAGHLDLVFTISRHGTVEKLDVKTPGLAPRVAKEIDGCVRAAVAPISFPARKTFTTATVPFFFQRTAAPNSGPQLSCWNPNGCRVNAYR